MAEEASVPTVRSLIRPMRWLLYAASTLVFLAGLQLSLLTEQTDSYFAWTIAPPLTAAFLGAAYWAAVPVELIAAREKVWAKARVAVLWPWALTTLTARAIGAWLIGIGFAALHANRENDLSRITPLAGGYVVFAVLELAALGRYAGTVNWAAPAAWIYLAFLLSILPVGLAAFPIRRWLGRS